MYFLHIEPGSLELHGQLFHVVLFGAEYEDAFKVEGFQEPFDQGDLLCFINDKSLLYDLGGGFGDGDIDLGGLVQYFFGQLADLGRHGGGEEQILSFWREKRNDLHDIINKAHVQHPVCLVQYQVLQTFQLDITHIEVSDHSSGCANDDVGACGKGLFFIGEIASVPAAIYSDGADRREIGQSFEVLSDLYGQLAGRDNDQGIDLVVDTGGKQLVDDGQEECGRLGLKR